MNSTTSCSILLICCFGYFFPDMVYILITKVPILYPEHQLSRYKLVNSGRDTLTELSNWPPIENRPQKAQCSEIEHTKCEDHDIDNLTMTVTCAQ